MKAETPPSDPPSPEALAEFLRNAPEELRGWAQQQLVQLDLRDEPPPVPMEPVPADSDLALAELGEVDDESRRRVKVHTPMDKAPTNVVVKGGRRGVVVPLIGIAVVAALVYGIFRLGLPPEQAEQAAGAPSATAQAGESGAARMAELEARLQDSPDDVAANLELGVLQFNNGDQQRARELWTRVTTVDPTNPQAWFNLGFIHLAQEPPDVEAARRDWDKVLEVAPESDLAATVRSHLGALEVMGSTSPVPTPSGK